MHSTDAARKRHRLLQGTWGRYARRVGRHVMLAALGLLALAALVRMLAALVEALTLMILALIAAVLVMPRHWRRHWRALRQQAAAWMYTAAQTLGSVAHPSQPEKEQQQQQQQGQRDANHPAP